MLNHCEKVESVDSEEYGDREGKDESGIARATSGLAQYGTGRPRKGVRGDVGRR